jgi:hypothetical protein
MFVYSVTQKDKVDAIFKNGYSRQFLGSYEGTDYGNGVYTNINLNDNIKRLYNTPNGCIIKIEILNGLDRYLIFDEKYAKLTYGENYSIKSQVYQLFPKDVADDIWKDFIEIMKNFPSAREHMNGRTAELLQVIFSPRRKQHYRKKYDELFREYDIRGVIYRGLKDGLCLVAYNFGDCVPVAYSFDGRKFIEKEYQKKKLDLADLKNMVTIYHATDVENVDGIFKYGYLRQFTGKKGIAFGAGVYARLSVETSSRLIGPHYGYAMMESKIIGGFDNYLIFDKEMAQQYYGNKYRILDQLKTMIPSDVAERIYKQYGDDASLYEKIAKQYGIRGSIYFWNGAITIIIYDFSLVIPYAVSFDKGKTFTKKVTQDNINRLDIYTDVVYKYGTKYKHISEPVAPNKQKGNKRTAYSLVEKKNGKFNYIDIQTGLQISPVDFDERPSMMHYDTGRFTFKIGNLYLIGGPVCFYIDEGDYREDKGMTYKTLFDILD